MKYLIPVFFIGIIAIALVGLFVFYLNDQGSSSDLEKQAEFLNSKHEYEKALFYYDQILQSEPNSSKVLLDKANALLSLNKFKQAIEVFDVVLDMDPNNDSAKNGKAHASLKMQSKTINFESVLNNKSMVNKTNMQQTVNSKVVPDVNPNITVVSNIPLIFEKLSLTMNSPLTEDILDANKLYGEEKYHEALSIYNHVLKDDPSNLYALNGKAGSLLSLQQFNDSIAVFETVLLIYPDNVNALNGKAYALYLKSLGMNLPGILYDSIHGYEKTLEIDPKNLNALVGIASALSALERYDEAVDYYLKALSVDPNYKNAKNGLFSLWIKLGNNEARYFYFDSAIIYFDKVLELDPKNLEALLAKASSYAEWGKSKEKYYSISEHTYTEILESYPNNTRALTGMGYVLSEQLEFKRSLFYYDKALEIEPDNLNAQRGKSFVVKRMN